MTDEHEDVLDCLWLEKELVSGDYTSNRCIRVNLMANKSGYIQPVKIDSIEISKEDLKFLLED